MRSSDTELGGKHAIGQTKNPNRVAAGKRNRELWPGLTPEGRERLRQAALAHQPWSYATGPRTPAGKAQAAANGRTQQKGCFSVRQLRAEVAKYRLLERVLRATRSTIGSINPKIISSRASANCATSEMVEATE